MYIPEEKIAEILAVSDIVDVISESVILKRSGRNYFGLCPFHTEKTPSFSVSPHKQIFHCFGCSAGGNVFSFLMKHHGISFPEAVKILAGKYGVEIDTGRMSPEMKQRLNLKEGLFRLNQRVMEQFALVLGEGPMAGEARSYLLNRGMKQETLDLFHLGYAQDSWDAMVSFLRRIKISRALAVQSGLVLPRKQTKGYYDRFRNRIIFPIFDVNMQVAGFGGRVMDDAMPKYLNSPETPVYSKGRILYGLHQAKQYCRKKDTVYIVEGYFDFLSLFQEGVKNVVASLGTALTSEHVRLLKGCASMAVLVFDSDEAGINAAKRSIATFIHEGMDVRVIVLPEGQDPDSYVMAHGGAAFERIAQDAVSAIPFLTETSVKRHGLSVEGRIAILDDIKPYLIQITDSAVRSMYVRGLAQRLDIDEQAVLERVREAWALRHSGKGSVPAEASGAEGTKDAFPVLESDPRESQIISMMLQFSEVVQEARARKILDYFYSDRLKRIGVSLTEADGREGQKVADFMERLGHPEDRDLIASLAMVEVPDVENILSKSVALMKRIVQVRKRNDNYLTNKIKQAEQGGDSDLSLELLEKRQREIRALRGYE